MEILWLSMVNWENLQWVADGYSKLKPHKSIAHQVEGSGYQISTFLQYNHQ